MLWKYKGLFNAPLLFNSHLKGSLFRDVLRRFSSKKENKELLDLTPIRAKFETKVSPLPNYAKAVEVHKHDIVLYNSDTSRYFNIMNAFGIAQLIFWYHSAFLLQDLKPYKVSAEIRADKRLSWYQKIPYYEYKNHLVYGSIVIGTAVMGFCVFHTMRCVRHVILKKGGAKVELGMYLPVYTRTRNVTFRVKDISCVRGREIEGYSIFKAKGVWYRFFVDCEGVYVRPDLYDKTLGVARKLWIGKLEFFLGSLKNEQI